jgi:hypothetical protein
MALIDLKSDLSWYGKGPEANRLKAGLEGLFKPGDEVVGIIEERHTKAGNYKTDFQYDRNSFVVSVTSGGYDNNGFFLSRFRKASANAFNVDDAYAKKR